MDTPQPRGRRASSSGQLHIDIGALDERVRGTEEAVRSIRIDIATNADRADRSFENQTKEFGVRIDKMSSELGAQIKAQAARPIPWAQISTLIVGIVVALGGFAGYAKTVEDNDIARNERAVIAEASTRDREIRDINTLMQPILAAVAQRQNDDKRFDALEKDVKAVRADAWPAAAQAEYEKRIDGNILAADKLVSLEHEYDQRDFGRLLDRVNALDGSLIKRPEIEARDIAHDKRDDTLSIRLNDVQTQVNSISPTGKILDEIWAELRESRNGNNAIAPLAPIAPIAPVLPAPSR